MNELKVFEMQQESAYRYTCITSYENLLELTGDYPFEEEVLEKAEFHKAHMNTPFSVTLRLSPDAARKESDEGIVLTFADYDIRDGRSKCAALRLLEPEGLEDCVVKLDIFLLEKEKMDLL